MRAKFIVWRNGLQLWSSRRGKALAIAGTVVVLLVGASLLVSMPAHRSSGAVSHQVASSASTSAAGSPSMVTGSATSQAAATNGPTHGSSAASSQTGIVLPTQRLVIETAGLDLTVSSVAITANQISDITVGDGGFVQTMQQSTDSQGQDFESMTVRIPQTQFQAALKQVKSFGKVNTFSQTGQDVTSQHDNLQQQIAELQSEEEAYTRLFDRATTMADMLQIQQSLTQVNSQLSNLDNQLHQLNRTVELATLNITLHQAAIGVPEKTAPTPFFAPLAESIRLMERIGIGLVKVVSWLLPWALIVGLLYGGVRLWRRGRSHHSDGK